MIYIKNKHYPPKGFRAITHWPFVFYKTLRNDTVRHETIHGMQQKELLIIFFYLIYLIEWIFKGYRNISFEKEAYENETNHMYREERKLFAWMKYL